MMSTRLMRPAFAAARRVAPRTAIRTYAAPAAADTKPPVALFGLDGTYANALYTAAAKQSALDPTAKAIASLLQILQTDTKLPQILQAPTLSDKDKSQIIAELEKHTGGADKSGTVKNFLQALGENNRLGLLEGVCEKFGTLMRAQRGELELTVTSAAKLDDKLLRRLETALSKSEYSQGKKLKVVTKVNPDILGGLVVEIGEQTIDLSVSSKISRLNKLLSDTVDVDLEYGLIYNGDFGSNQQSRARRCEYCPSTEHPAESKLTAREAGGHVGKHIVEALLKTGKHQVTAITRANSTSKLSDGVTVAKVDYDDQSSLVEALKGHDALLISIAVSAQGEQEKLIRAAAEANVPWVLPNEWGFDSANEAIINDMGMGERSGGPRRLISELGKSSYINVSTGFWYEWSMSFPDAFGFNFETKTITLFDEGEARTTVSSWPQVGRAVASLLSLKLRPDGPDDKEPSLEQFKNAWVYPVSFCVNQKDMLASVLRVTKTTSDDWKIIHEPTKGRFDSAIQEMKKGNGAAFVKAMYTRAFFSDEPTNVERWRGGSHNKALGLHEEEIDEYTQIGIERVSEMNAWLKSIHG
ncbi:ATP synthase F0 subcomplex subunit OSCP atp5 [Cladophialophora chaetospira]|uniref:ATP synthase subunit 5, mitochondrial n=1 Tax=Cladophialophora chaetospira TaxID=386627 RepID=A0AA38XLF0_9EURO|nr:ATP synthase F0 subcomplex subunit OSCP atp5 [Cladophialophora chaetospira]